MTGVERQQGQRYAGQALLLAGLVSFVAPSPLESASMAAINVRVCGSNAVISIPLGPEQPPDAPRHTQKPCHFCDLRRRNAIA